MYKVNLWDEDKWDIHSKSYNSSKYSNAFSSKKDDKIYNEQKYGPSEKSVSSDYLRKEEDKERETKEKDAFDAFEEEEKEKSEIKGEELTFKAAKQLFRQKSHIRTGQKKEIKTIEDAIKKAIEEEKKVIVIDS